MPHSAKATLFVLAATVGCAAELDGKPEEYIRAYNGPGGGGGTSDGGTSGGGTSAGGPSGGTGMVPVEPPCVKMVFEKSRNDCSTSCHTKSSASIFGGLDLTGPDLGKRLSTSPAKYLVSGDKGDCDMGALLIQPDNPARSVLLRKVKGMPSCGDAMPIGSSLMGEDLACIENWVNSFGASANQISLDEGSGTGGNNP